MAGAFWLNDRQWVGGDGIASRSRGGRPLHQGSLIEREGDGCCDANGREESVRTSVVACGDAPPVFEPGEEVLDLFAALSTV